MMTSRQIFLRYLVILGGAYLVADYLLHAADKDTGILAGFFILAWLTLAAGAATDLHRDKQ